MKSHLYYIHDPMCSWCYAFVPVWEQLQAMLPKQISVEYVLGGLAPDNDTPMDEAMRQRLQETWRRIEQQVPGIRFNFDFWQRNTPYRSTYPSCRAVIAAGRDKALAMTRAIQRGYYCEARNPSLDETLIALAAEIGLEREAFAKRLHSDTTRDALMQQIALARQLGVESYPSLVLATGDSRWHIPVDYKDPLPMLETIGLLLPPPDED